MKTFKQHCIEEGFLDKALAGALTLGAASAASVGYRMMNPRQEPEKTNITQPQIEETPKVESTHNNFHAGLQKKFGNEYGIILNAAKRNGISETDHDSLAMLFAIRKTENGRAGKEFGVLHKDAVGKPGQTLDKQAGWAASILMKRKGEWNSMSPKNQNQYKGFSHYLQTRYAPHGVQNDPKGLNKNWFNNFTTHYNEHLGFMQ